MKDYIIALIGAIAVIIAAIIGLFAKNGKRNKQTVKNVKKSNVCQANGSININNNTDMKE